MSSNGACFILSRFSVNAWVEAAASNLNKHDAVLSLKYLASCCLKVSGGLKAQWEMWDRRQRHLVSTLNSEHEVFFSETRRNGGIKIQFYLGDSRFSTPPTYQLKKIPTHEKWLFAKIHGSSKEHFWLFDRRRIFCKASTVSHCLKITQNVPFDFLNLGIFEHFLPI